MIDAEQAIAELRSPRVTTQDTPAGERAGLRGYLERLLGRGDAPAVEHALRSVDLAATHHAALVLCGDGDLVQVARGLHRHVLGDEHPFVLCDPRRRGTDADAPLENHLTGMAALGAATGGSVCLRSKWLPRDFAELAVVLRARGARVQLIICGPRPPVRMELVLAPIKIPALPARHHELDRIIDEYAREAAGALRSSAPFTATDRDWVRMHSATSLPEIEKGAWRILALRETGSIARAAALLGMGHTALGDWFRHRRTERSVRKRDGPRSSRANPTHPALSARVAAGFEPATEGNVDVLNRDRRATSWRTIHKRPASGSSRRRAKESR